MALVLVCGLVIDDLLDLRIHLRNKLAQLRSSQPFVTLPELASKSFLILRADLPLLLRASARDASQLIEVNRGIVEELTNIDRPPLEPLAVLNALQNSRRLARLLLSVGLLLRRLPRLKMQIQVIVINRFFRSSILKDHVLDRLDLLLFAVVADDACLLLHLQSRVRVDLLLVHQLLLAPIELRVGRALLPVDPLDALKLIGVHSLLPVQLHDLVVACAAVAVQVASVALQDLEAVVAGAHVVRRAIWHVDRLLVEEGGEASREDQGCRTARCMVLVVRQNAVLRDGEVCGGGRSVELFFLRIEVDAADEPFAHRISFSVIGQRPIAESDAWSSTHWLELSDLSSPE